MKFKLVSQFLSAFLVVSAARAATQPEIDITTTVDLNGWPKPIPVSISGFTGEVDAVLKNDLLFMGIANVAPEQAKNLISGNNAGLVEGRVIKRVTTHE